jgi:hypothetical protein
LVESLAKEGKEPEAMVDMFAGSGTDIVLSTDTSKRKKMK